MSLVCSLLRGSLLLTGCNGVVSTECKYMWVLIVCMYVSL